MGLGIGRHPVFVAFIFHQQVMRGESLGQAGDDLIFHGHDVISMQVTEVLGKAVQLLPQYKFRGVYGKSARLMNEVHSLCRLASKLRQCHPATDCPGRDSGMPEGHVDQC